MVSAGSFAKSLLIWSSLPRVVPLTPELRIHVHAVFHIIPQSFVYLWTYLVEGKSTGRRMIWMCFGVNVAKL